MKKESIKIVEVGPRDGLQNESTHLSVDDRVKLVRELILAGAKSLEVGAFVSPKAIPQMVDSEKVAEQTSSEKAELIYLVPNEKGLERALVAKVKSIAVFTATSSSFTQKNIGTSVEESLKVFEKVIAEAHQAKMKVRAHISTVFGCPYEGYQNPAIAIELTEKFLSLGCYEVAICDTIGVAHPRQISKVFKSLKEHFGLEKIAGHFHDTRGMAILNIRAAIEEGGRIFDSSIGGLGGCPYAPGSAGNVATEEVAWFLEGMDFDTGLSVEKLLKLDEWIESKIGRKLRSKLYLSQPKRLYYDLPN